MAALWGGSLSSSASVKEKSSYNQEVFCVQDPTESKGSVSGCQSELVAQLHIRLTLACLG